MPLQLTFDDSWSYFRPLMVCISMFFLPALPPSPLHSCPFSRPRCTHPRGTRFAGALFETLVSPAAARSSTFNSHRTKRLHGPHFREEAVFRKCPLPPERALSGLSWEFAGSDRGSPPGMGSTLGTGISPRGPPTVTRGEGPKVLDCCTPDSFWEPFWHHNSLKTSAKSYATICVGKVMNK